MENYKERYEEAIERIAKLDRRLEIVNSKLLKSEELKSDFLSNIKNEINNPLTSILGLVRQIVSAPENTKQTETYSNLIYSEMSALDFQIRNIFNAAEIEAGQSFPELSNVNIKNLIMESVESFSHLASKKNITIELDFNSDEKVISDREKLVVIMANLLSNAIKFSHEDSKIIITTRNDSESNFYLDVQDFGVGIETKYLGQIYDRFRQLDTGTRKEFGGHGLGLSIVHSLVDILEGTLEMITKFQEGTVFKIVLPLKELGDDVLQEDEILFTNDESEGETF
jgi:signal transduction histidine kinase